MIYPVLLCGGAGTRLWPTSRVGLPKQFARLVGHESLFSATARRLSDAVFAPPTIITSKDYRFLVTDQLAQAAVEPRTILIEPSPKNTAPAVLAAALEIAQSDPDALLLICPCDHSIPDAAAFRKTITAGEAAARSGSIVTFGVTPTRAETGYGWLEMHEGDGDVVQLRRFVEKPSADEAQAMLDTGRFLWNAGIFMCMASALIAEFQRQRPELLGQVCRAVELAQTDLSFLVVDEGEWAAISPESVDYAIMEGAPSVTAVRFRERWSDLGSWDAVADELGSDTAGNSTSGPVMLDGCTNTLVRSESDEIQVVGIGLNDLIVVASRDAVLVADKSCAQQVRHAVKSLEAKGIKQALSFPVDHRPWGYFEALALSDRFQVKRITVKPGGILSLQSHLHRSEHWIVVSGTARVTIGQEVRIVTENESVYIPLGIKHRMENPGKLPMVLIEVQTGAYLGEDDITRYEDAYARGQGARG